MTLGSACPLILNCSKLHPVPKETAHVCTNLLASVAEGSTSACGFTAIFGCSHDLEVNSNLRNNKQNAVVPLSLITQRLQCSNRSICSAWPESLKCELAVFFDK